MFSGHVVLDAGQARGRGGGLFDTSEGVYGEELMQN